MRRNGKENIKILLFGMANVVKMYIHCANLHFLKVELNEKNGEKCYSMSIRNQGGKENGKAWKKKSGNTLYYATSDVSSYSNFYGISNVRYGVA